MAEAVLARDRAARAEARARLVDLARRSAPVTLAGDRRLEVTGPFRELIGGPVPRGSVVTITGAPGSGATSAAVALVAAATAAGEWAAFVDTAPRGTRRSRAGVHEGPGSAVCAHDGHDGLSLGGLAMVEAGVELARCGVVRGVPRERWSTVVGALLDGVLVVVATVPPRLALGDARRLQARARERQAVLVALESVPGARTGTWPADATRRIVVEGVEWHGLERGGGLLEGRVVRAHVAGKGVPPRTARVVA